MWAAFLVMGLGAGQARAWESDNGDGTFKNPVIYADYADPDIIRVGSDFYMISTTFADSPGLNLLHSEDLVNWELISHVASTLDGGDAYNLVGGNAYRAGFWASSIRYHNGTFYVVANPAFANSRIYYATNPAGPWQYYQLDRVTYDPGLFFDTDGTGYIVCGHGPQSVMRLNSTYSAIVSQTDNVIDSGGEGSHLVKRGSYYYLFNANPGIWPFQLRCARATNIYGPWETGHVCLTATTGGHQGGLVDIDDNDNWFGFVHQDSGAIGRMPRIGPVFWENDWPVFGTASARDQIAASYPKPILGKTIKQPASSDDFSASTLGLQWQWNHNPDDTKWSLAERAGYLRLRPTQSTGFWTARNSLTQKAQGPQSSGVVKLDVSNLQAGDNVGFGTLGKVNGRIYVTVDSGGNRTLGMEVDNRGVGSYTAASGVAFTGSSIYLRTDLDFQQNLGVCSYSADGTTWTKLGGNFPLDFDITYSTFQGEKFAISCFNANPGAGYVDVDSFTLTDTAALVVSQRGRPKLNAARTTFVADNGQLLRGPYFSTEGLAITTTGYLSAMKSLGFNSVHLYAENLDLNYPASGSTAPGYSVTQVDQMVQMTRDLGLYLVITIGNGANNGNHNKEWAKGFWNFYAPRYKDETHVVYEIHNEPVAWGPPYLTATTPSGALDMEVDCYNIIRTNAPNTPVLLFTYAVLGGSDGATAALTDIHAFNERVFGDANAVWTNEAVGFHGYAGWEGTTQAVEGVLAAGYPCFMTEFGSLKWGTIGGGQDVELTSELERLGVSWLTFQYIPPSGVSDNVTLPEVFKDRIESSGLSWVPDYGTWPAARQAYGNNGQPRQTANTWTNDFLTGALHVEAEDFDVGGQGVAYNDTWSVNEGGQYRTSEGVDITTSSDTGGGYAVGGTATGEWLEYTIWVKQPGFYDLKVRYAASAASSIQVTCKGTDVTGTWALASTGGANTWATVTRQVFLETGRQKIRLNITAGAPTFNWLEATPSTAATVANGTYKFINRNSGKAMEEDAANGVAIQNTYTGAATQQWTIQHVGAGQYKVVSAADTHSWNLPSIASGDPLGLVWWWGATGDAQRFIITSAESGYYRFTPVVSGFSLGVAGASQADAAAVQQFVYTGVGSRQWAIQPLTALPIPGGLTVTVISSNEINLSWTAAAGAVSYTVNRATSPNGPFTAIASGLTTPNYVDMSITPGTTYYYSVTAVGSGGEESLSSSVARVLPPWQWQDIGTVGSAGDTTSTSGVFTVSGSGADIWGVEDAFHFVYMPVSGDCSIVTRVTSLQNVDQWSKAGPMIRASLTPDAACALMSVTPGNGVNFQFRTTAGAGSNTSVTTGLAAPYWLKLVRSGDVFTGYRSVDGVNWVQQGSQTITMGATVYLGLAVTSHNNSTLCTAVFDNVTTVPDWLSSATPEVPATPTGLAATALNASAVVNWSPVSGATSYNVKRATVSGGPYTTLQSIGGASYPDAGLANGVTYYYVVSAVNAAGESANSAPVAVTPSTAVNFTTTSVAGQDGYVTGVSGNATGGSSNSASGTLRTGDSTQNRQYKTILSFDTSAIPSGAFISSAAVKMKRSTLTGTDPFTTLGALNVDIVRGGFDSAPAIGAADFQASADATQVATMSNPGANDAWSSGTLSNTGCDFISRGGTTQLRVAFATPTNSNATSDYVAWYSGNDATSANWPVLELSYGLTPGSGALVARLKFDETSGLSAADSTGNGWTGALVGGPSHVAGFSGNAIALDGIDDHVTLPVGVASGLTDFTIAAWVKLDSLSIWSRIFDFGTGTDNYMFLTPSNGATNVVRFAIRTPTLGEQVIDGTAALPVGEWTHVAVTLSGSTGTIYVNGVAVGTNTAITLTPFHLGATTQNYIGKSQWPDPLLAGEIDDFLISGSALSAADIAALAAPPATPAGFIAAADEGKVTLNWSVASGAASYRLGRATTSGGPYTTIASGLAGTSYVDFDVVNNTTYYYVLTGVNGAAESAASAEVEATPLAPPLAPGGVAAVGGDASIALSWQSALGASSYTVKRALVSGGPYTVAASGLTSLAYTDASRTNGTTYYYVVTASNAAGESPASAQVSAKATAPITTQERQSTALSVSGGTTSMTVQSVLGHTYQLQYCDDLVLGAWQNYGTVKNGTGASLSLTMPVDLSVPRRFYRIVIEP